MKKYVGVYVVSYVVATIVLGVFVYLTDVNVKGISAGLLIACAVYPAKLFADDFGELPTGKQKALFASGVVLFNIFLLGIFSAILFSADNTLVEILSSKLVIFAGLFLFVIMYACLYFSFGFAVKTFHAQNQKRAH